MKEKSGSNIHISKMNSATYLHLDYKISKKKALKYILDKMNVEKHAFYPFITFDKIFYKIYKENKEVVTEIKKRKICYSAHIDRYIYQYYGSILNEKYNKYIFENGFSDCAIAYRTDLKKNNIHFACEAFKFISKGDCYVMVGDFKGFFDNLKHNFLKEKLIQVLNVPTLDRDWYNIYKNITRFSTINLLDVLNVNDILSSDEILEYENVTKRIENNNTRKARKMLKKIDNKINEFNEYNIDYNKRIRKKALSSKQFKELKSGVALNKSKVGIEINRSRVGIPQGAALSSVLSNVYMIDFDKNISEVVKKHNGIYFRYSDDFIIVIPKNQNLELDLKQLIEDYSSKYGGLKLENKKTKTYEFNSGNIETKDKKKYVDYLGFTFDGKCVKIRDKTLSKFYSRLHKKLNFIVECNGVTKYNNKISNRILYKNYSMKGRSGFISMNDIRNGKRLSHKDGNFLTYVYKANKIFNCFNNVHPYNSFDIDTNAINKTRTRNLVIIRRKLKKIKC